MELTISEEWSLIASHILFEKLDRDMLFKHRTGASAVSTDISNPHFSGEIVLRFKALSMDKGGMLLQISVLRNRETSITYM